MPESRGVHPSTQERAPPTSIPDVLPVRTSCSVSRSNNNPASGQAIVSRGPHTAVRVTTCRGMPAGSSSSAAGGDEHVAEGRGGDRAGMALRVTGGSAIATCLDSNHSLTHLDLSWNKVLTVPGLRLLDGWFSLCSHPATHSGARLLPVSGRKTSRLHACLLNNRLLHFRCTTIRGGILHFVPTRSLTKMFLHLRTRIPRTHPQIGDTNAATIGSAIENNQVRWLWSFRGSRQKKSLCTIVPERP